MAEQLLKRWNNWEDGIGYVIDDGEHNGLYKASGLLGLRGELRVAPFKNTVAVGIDASHHYQYFLEEPVANELPIYDASSSGSINNGTGSGNISHTVANQPNRALFVWVFVQRAGASPGTPTVTYNNVAATFYNSAINGSFLTGFLFILLAPSVGANNLVVTLAQTGDAVIIASSLYRVSQSAPRHAEWVSASSGTVITRTGIDSSTNEIIIAGSATAQNTTDTKDAAETLVATVLNAGSDLRGTVSRKTGAAAASMTHTLGNSGSWVFVGCAITGTAPGPSHLYAMRGSRGGNTPSYLDKVDLFNNNFGVLESGSYTLTNLLKTGQPTRYQGFWWLPDGDEFDPRKLTPALGAPSGELAASSAWASGGADHLSNMGGQMIAALKDNGFAILAVDGTPTTTTDWGSYFQAGDKNERAAAVVGTRGLSFVLTAEGLFSFTKTGRSGLVFEDFRSWRNVFDNIPMAPWRGGFVFPGPTGELLFYTPGELPVNIGIKSRGFSPLGVTEPSGRYMGVHATGDYVWVVYQPDLSSTSVDIQCGYPRAGDPRDLTWQTVAISTLNDAQHLLGCFVSAQSQPLSSTYYTPCAWFGDGTDLAYLILDPRAGPFRARGDTHRVLTSADAHHSEIEFAEPQDLTRIVVYTGSDRVAGDEWQISLITDGGNDDVPVGAPIRDSGIRHERLINRHSVQRIMLHVTFVGTSTASRVPPAIKRIDLFGVPSRG